MSQRQFGPANGGPVDLSDADLQGMVLRHSTLTDASLIRSNLVATDLVQARLEGADLTGADLTDAVLDYSDLAGANLTGAILVGTSLVNVRGLTQEQIAQAYGDASTALPAYLLPPENWFPPLEGSLFEEYDTQIDLSPLSNDPYEVLGVPQNATFDEIRTSFRSLVKKLHPDLNPDDAVAQERFKRVSIAYRILGDPVKRDRYNRGEIDTNGDVHPEYEAKKEFRRYAYRFYAAAVASLILAAGILGAVWYTFWLQDTNTGPGNMQIAEAGPSKLIERLGTQRLLSEPEQQVAPAEMDSRAVAPAKIAAVAAAVEASEKLNSGNSQKDAAGAQTAGSSALYSGPDSDETVQDGIASEPLPKVNTSGDATTSSNADTDPAEQLAFSRAAGETPASAVPPLLSPASELNVVKPALGRKTLSEAGQQTFAESAPTEAVETSQASSSRITETASIIDDENNKLATLIKDIKTLAANGPLSSVPSFQPQWPSAHSVVLKKRHKTSPANDSISDVFRLNAMSQLQNAQGQHTAAADADSLQLTRKKQSEGEFVGLKLNFALPDSEFESFPEILVNPDATTQFLRQSFEKVSILDTVAMEAKTLDQGQTPTVTQSDY